MSGVINLEMELDYGDDVPAEQVSLITGQLQQRLRVLPLDDISRKTHDDVPEGAMPGGVITFNTILIAVLPTVVPILLQFLLDRLKRQEAEVTIRRKVGD
jgi:hypothetical protein